METIDYSVLKILHNHFDIRIGGIYPSWDASKRFQNKIGGGIRDVARKRFFIRKQFVQKASGKIDVPKIGKRVFPVNRNIYQTPIFVVEFIAHHVVHNFFYIPLHEKFKSFFNLQTG